MDRARYQPIQKINSGGWADVWLADDRQLGRQVAVKLFDPQSPEISSALRHAQALARVAHPNVVMVHEVGRLDHPEEGEERDAIVMEYVPGPTLGDRLNGPRLNIGMALDIGRGLTAGLTAIHESGAVHGDLHDGNVLVTAAGATKIIDILERFSLRGLPTIRREQAVAIDCRALRGLLRSILGVVAGLDESVVRAFDKATELVLEPDELGVAFERALGAFPGENAPSAAVVPLTHDQDQELVDRVKEFLAEPRHRIRLSDLVDAEIRAHVMAMASNGFGPHGPLDAGSLAERIEAYEAATRRLVLASMLIARWGSAEHDELVRRVARHLSCVRHDAGTVLWLRFQWFPLQLVSYGVALSCVATGDYRMAQVLWTQGVASGDEVSVLAGVSAAMAEVSDAWKMLPGMNRKHTPCSEHLHGWFAPIQDALLFLGTAYEEAFDQAEVMMALVHADLRHEASRGVWGPVGRFGWKHSRGFRSPFTRVVDEATRHGGDWAPLKAGMFGGDAARFQAVAQAFDQQLLSRLGWW